MPKHALLSASAAERWINCTAAPRYEAQFPATTSEYAEEGTLAHKFCELKTLKKFTTALTERQYKSRLKKLYSEPLYADEMDRTSDAYVEYLTALAMSYNSPPLVNAEVRVDFSRYVPEGFGTCDCVIIGGNKIDIVDYKHGRGVPVPAENNPQMRLYALGALAKYEPFYGDMIKTVQMTVFQPRIQDQPDSETLTVEELKAWGESIKPIAKRAFDNLGEFVPGDWCRFCRGKAQCRARAEKNSALEDFKDCIIPTLANLKQCEKDGQDGIPTAPILTHAEIGELLVRGDQLLSWYFDLKDYALSAILKGEEIPGWKAVEGRSNRTFTDSSVAAAAVIAAGYDASLVYERKMKTLTEIEKLMGKEEFAEKMGSHIYKPPGKPTLAPTSDKRAPYSSAAADFGEVA